MPIPDIDREGALNETAGLSPDHPCYFVCVGQFRDAPIEQD
jgi:hypothetical protein